jgi:hypothetical protein
MKLNNTRQTCAAGAKYLIPGGSWRRKRRMRRKQAGSVPTFITLFRETNVETDERIDAGGEIVG